MSPFSCLFMAAGIPSTGEENFGSGCAVVVFVAVAAVL